MSKEKDSNNQLSVDVVIVGAGFAGLLMLHQIRELGLSVRVYERGADVGGTWFWNRYPGARCDTESLEYSYQFSTELFREWKWSERFATQPELLRYAQYVAHRFNLHTNIQLNTSVEKSQFDERLKKWLTITNRGESVSSDFLILATGCLSTAHLPKIPEMSRFRGKIYHTGNWPKEEVNLSGQAVGIIGTGSSAVQIIPAIVPQVEHLYVFQRTANYVVPAWNGQIPQDYELSVMADPVSFRRNNAKMIRAHGYRNRGRDQSALSVSREEVESDLERRWNIGGLNFLDGFNDLLTNSDANKIAAEFVKAKIRKIVKNSAISELLCPNHPIGCKRVSVGDDYYESFNSRKVTLVDISRSGIIRLSEDAIEAEKGVYRCDSLIFATGFDAMTGPILSINIVGRGGVTLREKWREGPRNYLGLAVNGFPNLFIMTGPGSPSVLTNMHVSIDQHAAWIARCIKSMRSQKFSAIEATESSELSWVEVVSKIASHTIFPSCNSWYLGANVPNKPRMFMPYIGFPSYESKCKEIEENNYFGFKLT
jgi:cyclohexanone monooxygenase